MGLLEKWNKNKFSIYQSEEKTILKLLESISKWIEDLIKGVEEKTDLYGDHKGSWQGLDKPTLSEEGMRATVEQLSKDVPAISGLTEIDLLKDDFLLFASYMDGRFKAKNDFTLYVGNTEKAYPINSKEIIEFVTGVGLWDIHTFIHNNKFYFIGDYREGNTTWGGNAFLLIESEDLKSFKQYPIKIKSNTINITQTWAPKIFKDGDKTYLVYCLQKDNESYIDYTIRQARQYKLEMYYSIALDDTLTNWSEPYKINIGTSECYIDPYIIKKGEVYHLFACRGDDAKIAHFTATSMAGLWSLDSTLPFPSVTEAPAPFKFNDKYYIFVDSERATGGRDSGFVQIMESDDLYTWTNLKEYKNTSNTTMRHFAPCVINDKTLKEKIKNMIKNEEKHNNNYFSSNNNILNAVTKNNISYFDLASITPVNGIIEELFVMPNTIYYLNSQYGTVTINKINASNLKNFETFSFVINSFSDTTIIIKNNSDKHGFLESQSDMKINGGLGSTIYTFTTLDGYIKHITPVASVTTKEGNGVPNTNYLATTPNDFECKYIVNGKICVVSYILKFSNGLTDTCVLVTGLPKPAMGTIFNSPINGTDNDNKYGTYKINDDGTIIEWYGSKPNIGTIIKGSFTYVVK